MLDACHDLTSARWSACGAAGVRATLGFRAKLPRKLRRALSSRRWQKKVSKALSAMLGYPVEIQRPHPCAIDTVDRELQ